MKDHTHILHLEKEKLILHSFKHEQKQDEISFDLGYGYIADTFFKNDLPTETETEDAINFIEDELMRPKNLNHNHERLITKNVIIKEVFQKFGIDREVIQRQEIEDVFSNLARIIRRKYGTEGLEITAESFAVVLLLREITHHLNFEAFTLL